VREQGTVNTAPDAAGGNTLEQGRREEEVVNLVELGTIAEGPGAAVVDADKFNSGSLRPQTYPQL
jgi:hypothetical protein